MRIQTFSAYLSLFSIRQKLWGGFALVLSVLVVVVINTMMGLSETKNKVDVVTQDIQPALIASMELRNTLKEATTSLGFYLLTKQEQHKQAYHNYLQRLDTAIAKLKKTAISQQKDRLALVQAIEKDIEIFKTYERQMLHLAQTLTENFTALGYSGSNMNPLTRELLQAVSNMILSEAEEEASDERKQLLTAIADLRYTWTSVVNNIRIYLFYGNDDALSNVKLFMGGAKELVTKIKEMGVELTFEQEEGLEVAEDVIAKWEEHIKVVVDIYKGDKARMDAFLIKSEVGPLLASVDQNLQALVDKMRASTDQTGEALKLQAQSTENVVSTLLIVGLGIGAALSWLITAVIVTPLRAAAAAMEDIADGEGDLTRRLEKHGRDEVSHVAGGFNRFIEKIQQIIKQVSDAVLHLNSSAEEMAEVTTETTKAIAKQKEETTQIATAVCEMSATAKEVATNAELAAEAARNADGDTHQSKQVVTQAVEGIGALGSEIHQTAEVIQKLGIDVQGIGEVINVIRGVTEQTNLLALNAAIEAARAGEQGRGFAVVADEVRTLADRANQSTNEISEKVEILLIDAKSAVARMEKNSETAQSVVQIAQSAGESLNAVTQAVSNINDMTYQIASAAEQQSCVAEEVNKNIENVTQLADSADDAARMVANGSASLKQLSELLNGLVSRFKI